MSSRFAPIPSWLLVAAAGALGASLGACGGSTEQSVPGTLTVTVHTTGPVPDPDGYRLVVDGADVQAVERDDSLTLSDLAAGTHTIALRGLAANCEIDRGDSATVSVAAGQSATLDFAPVCRRAYHDVIVFYRALGGAQNLAMLDPHGGGPTPLSGQLEFGTPSLSVSPTGTRVAYVTYVDHGPNLVVVNLDGTEERTVLRSKWPSFNISGKVRWLPGGREVSLSYYDYSGDRPEDRFVVVDMTGAVKRTVAVLGGTAWIDWSPDGRRIALEQNGGVLVVNADGSGVQPLRGHAQHPVWSPDGSRIAYNASGTSDVYVMQADGSAPTRVGALGTSWDWSPDGAGFVYADAATSALYQIRIGEASGTRLSGTDYSASLPSWAR